jgi:D-xylulose reductase
MEPLSVGVHSVFTQAKLQPAQSIAVFGCGPVGLLCMAVAKAIGALRIIAVDIVQSRLDFAKVYAATEVFQPPPLQEGESKMAFSQRSASLLRATLGVEDRGSKAIDVVVDASGAEVSIQTGILIARVGGTFVQVRLSLCPVDIFSHTITGRNGTPGSCCAYHYFYRKGTNPQGLLPLWRMYYLYICCTTTDM